MLPLHCFNVVFQFEFEFFKFEFKLNLFESLAKERKKSLFRPKTPQPAQPFFFSPFLPAQPNPAGPIPSPRPSSRPLSSLPPTGRPHLSGPSPSSRARLGLEPESGHATPRRPSPWRARQGGPTSPQFKRRRSPWKPYRTTAAPQFAQTLALNRRRHWSPARARFCRKSRRSAARSPPQAASGAPHCGENIHWSPSPLPLAPVHARSLAIALPSNLAVERALRHV